MPQYIDHGWRKGAHIVQGHRLLELDAASYVSGDLGIVTLRMRLHV